MQVTHLRKSYTYTILFREKETIYSKKKKLPFYIICRRVEKYGVFYYKKISKFEVNRMLEVV